MNIGILSGKGGTGKTSLSTNLAVLLKANYIDCDVEEPNGHIFLKPQDSKLKKMYLPIPLIDNEKCSMCQKCVKSCNFNALAAAGDKIMLFPKLCHGCKVCGLVCPTSAISFDKKEIGKIIYSISNDINCTWGELNVSEPSGVPIIKKIVKDLYKNKLNIIDCAPGTSCNVTNVLPYLDEIILVTEPTPLGLHDLDMAVNLVKKTQKKFSVVINKDDMKDNIIKKYCEDNNVDIIGRIPFSKEYASVYSKGELLINDDKFKRILTNIANEINIIS